MTQRIAGIKGLFSSPASLRRGMNLWPPLLACGIRIEHIADDWSEVRVKLAKTPLTSNYFGTQYGGSLFSMTDPFFSIMVLRRLGNDYVVWDQSAEIDFVAPGKTAVRTTLTVTDEVIEELRAEAADGEKVLKWFACEITDTSGALVARVRKQLYVRRKR